MGTELLGTRGGLHLQNIDGGDRFVGHYCTRDDDQPIDHHFREPYPNPPSAMEHFIEAIVSDTPHIADGKEGHTVMHLLDAIYQSAASGKAIDV